MRVMEFYSNKIFFFLIYIKWKVGLQYTQLCSINRIRNKDLLKTSLKNKQMFYFLNIITCL